MQGLKPAVLLKYLRRLAVNFLDWLLHMGKIKLSILLFLTLIFTALQFSFVQTFLAQQLTAYLSQKSDFPIQVDRVSIRWFDEATLQNVLVKDRQKNNMIKAEKITVNYSLFDLIYGEDIVLQDVHLANGRLHMIADSLNINLVEWIGSFGSSADTTTTPSTSKFIIEHIALDDMSFYYDDLTSPPVTDGSFDGLHLHFDNISGQAYQLVVGDDVRLNIKHLKAWESNSRLPIHQLSMAFKYSDTQMAFEGLKFRFGQESLVSDTLILDYKNVDALADFNNQVKITAHLDSTVLSYHDLGFFAPDLRKFSDKFTVSGNFKGKVNHFNFKNLDLRFGQNTHLKGLASMEGLPNIDETFMQLKFDSSRFDIADIAQYLGKETFEAIPKIGEMDFKGELIGFLYDFVAKGDFRTQFGNLQTDLNLKTEQEIYSGKIQTQEFDLGKLLGNSALQKISINSEISGTGFDLDKADLKINAQIPFIGLSGYTYKNIRTNAHLSKNIIQGDFAVQDSNVRFQVSADINLLDSTVKAKGTLDTLFVHKLGFSPDHIFAKTRFSADFKGLTPDDAEGFVDFHNTYFSYKHQGIDIKKLAFRANHSGENRSLILDSNLFRFKLNGQFLFSKITDDIMDLKEEYALYFQNQDSLQAKYYQNKKIEIHRAEDAYKMSGELVFFNFQPLLNLFSHETHIGVGTKLNFSFSKQQDSYISLQAKIDTLIHADKQIYGTNLSLNSHKSHDSKEILGDLLLTSDNQQIGDLKTEKLHLEANLLNETVEFTNFIKFKESTDQIDLNGKFIFDDHFYRLMLLPSTFNFIGQEWKNPDSTQISIRGKEINFKQVAFDNGTRGISIEGDISEDPEKKLNVTIKDLGLDIFQNFFDFELKGIVNGTTSVQNMYKKPKAGGMLQISDVQIDGFLIGSLQTYLEYDQEKNAFILEADMIREGQEVMEVIGSYYFDKKEALDFHVELLHTSLQSIEPFVKDNLSDLDGTLTGALDIKGSADAPIVTGALEIFKGKMRVKLSNVVYYFEDIIQFEEDRIVMDGFKVTDGEKGKANIEGGIYHDGFNNFMIQLEGTFRRFKALDTERSKEIYYGKAYLSGDFRVFGSLSKLDISGNIKTERNTKVYMPLDGYSDISAQEDFIRFVPPVQKDSSQNTVEIPKKAEDELKMDMKFNVEITPQAYCEIIFDKKAGDIMRGNGKGKLRVEMPAEDELKIFGDIEITKGAYNFTFLNVVNKEFTVGKGSHINWTGDPFEGSLDIKAQYTQTASLAPIIDNADSSVLSRPEIRRRYPIRTDLFVTGKVLKPEIRFGVEILNYPSTITAGNTVIPLSSYVAAFQNRLETDDQELNRQVFSLMVLKQLSSANAFASLGQSAGRSVSELLTNQLSSWMSQVDDKLEIGLDLNGLDADALKTFQLRLSYSFLNGRFRISRDGGFTNVNNQTDASSLIGDWTLEYLVTKDGKVLLKMYHKNAVTGYNAGGLANGSVAGVSLLYTRSFNSLSELFPKKSDKEDQ